MNDRIHRTQAAWEGASHARGKAAAHPEAVLVAGSDLVEGKAGNVHELDPSGERFGDPPDQIPRRAAQEQEDRLPVRVVADGAERFEQPGQPLYLVEDDESLPVAQHPLRRPGQEADAHGPRECGKLTLAGAPNAGS